MKSKVINILIIMFLLSNCIAVYSEPQQVVKKKELNIKQYNMIAKKDTSVPDISFGADEPPKEELIQVSVRNDFDEEIKVKFDTNREYPIGPHESISLGQRKPGKYTLTIYNNKGEFVDNLTKNIDLKNKFVLNKDTVTNSNKITGLSTGQKVAITAGALGAAAVGGVLLNNALQQNNEQEQPSQYVPPAQVIAPEQNIPQVQIPVIPSAVQQVVVPQGEKPIVQDNQFAPGGMAIKLLNAKYPQVTIIVEGADGNPIGNNWVIPMVSPERAPQPLVFSGSRITVNPDQKIKAVLPNGFELQRYAFELEIDFTGDSYLWILK